MVRIKILTFPLVLVFIIFMFQACNISTLDPQGIGESTKSGGTAVEPLVSEIQVQRTPDIKIVETAAVDKDITVQEFNFWGNKIIVWLLPFSWWYDLDLHAYTPDGKHVGINYETGTFEMQIPGAVASGGLFMSSEWIAVPEDSSAYFIVSNRATILFLEKHPYLDLGNEDELYAFSVSYFDENLKGAGSGLVELTISPGAEVFHQVEIQLLPDGRYQLDIRQGLDLMNLEAWEAAVDEIPNELFINNPAQQKGTLKNELRTIFTHVEMKDYHGAINQIQNDLLKKLNTDGQADWVVEPVLVDELGALTAMLKYKLR